MNKDVKRATTILINGTPKELESKSLFYEELVGLAFGGNPPVGPYVVITVTYRRGHGNKQEGDLQPGEQVTLKEGMIFNVTATDKS